MSFRIQPSAPARPNRCQLFGPGSRPALFEKMAASAADVINLDLEDSVAPDDKPQARANIVSAINDIDASALESLEEINRRLADGGVTLHLSEVKGPVMDRLAKTSFLKDLTGKVFRSQFDAIAVLDPSVLAA